MRPYAWSCPSCRAANAPAPTACFVCGCPSFATTAQIEAYRRAHAGTGPPVRELAPKQPLPIALNQALLQVRSQLRNLVFLGVLLASTGVYVTLHTEQLSERSRMELAALFAVGFCCGPAAVYLARLKCPRCEASWLPRWRGYSEQGAFVLWSVSHGWMCSQCGLSPSQAKPPKR